MRITRTFHPVGHGAFFTEVFDLSERWSRKKFTVVYDCGSLSRLRFPLKAQIVEFFGVEQNYSINYLFISHLDADHINGIRFLIEIGCLNKDTTIVLPFYKNYQIELYEIQTHNHSDLFSTLNKHGFRKVFFVPSGWGDNTEAMEIDVEEDERYFKEHVDNDKYPVKRLYLKSVEVMGLRGVLVRANTIFTFKGVWNFIPFAMNDAASKDFFDKIDNNSIVAVEDIDNMYEVFKKHFRENEKLKEIKRIYNAVGGRREGDTLININSLAVISFSVINIRENRINVGVERPRVLYSFDGEYRSSHAACVYTGDLNLKTERDFDQFEKRVLSYGIGRIDLMQVSHHGSANSFNKRFASDISAICFVNYDSRRELFDIKMPYLFFIAQKPLISITEQHDSKVVESIEILG